MALTIEDGTGVTGADSFITEAEFDTTQVDYYGSALTGDTAAKEAAIRRAFLFMRSLQWLESSDHPTFDGTIPDDIKVAQGLFAREELSTPGALAPSVVAGQQKILTGVGDLTWTPTGSSGVDSQRTTVTLAMDMLKSYLSGTGQTKFLERG